MQYKSSMQKPCSYLLGFFVEVFPGYYLPNDKDFAGQRQTHTVSKVKHAGQKIE